MTRLPPIPPASRPTHGPEAVPKAFTDVTHRVRHRAERDAGRARDDAAVAARGTASALPGVPLPLLKLGLAGFAGYVLGVLAARR